MYDQSWRAQEVKTLDDLRALQRHSDMVLLGYLDDPRDSLDFAALRQGQRTVPQQFMSTALAYRSSFNDSWSVVNSSSFVAILPDDTLDTEPPHQIPASRPHNLKLIERLVSRASKIPDIEFRTSIDSPSFVSWVDASDHKTHEQRIALLSGTNDSAIVSSSVGHVFTLRRQDDGSLVDFHIVRSKDRKVKFGEQRRDPDVMWTLSDFWGAGAKCTHRITHTEDPHVDRTESAEIVLREVVQDLLMQKRLALSDVQVALTPALTTDGFVKRRMPEGLWTELRTFYQSHYENSTVRETDGGPLYNQRVTPTWHTPLPEHLRERVFAGLRPVMSEWVGGLELIGTSCYGIRTYSRGSYLHLHVDTVNTHVVSGIINVNQSTDADWPLEILDHDGVLHSVVMSPGDLLLYESAKLLHGRPRPLDGSNYANVFVHYRPHDGWKVSI
jgi:hypothetical protein